MTGELYHRVIQIPGSYWAATLVGWLQPIAGDLLVAHPGTVVVRRNSGRMDGLGHLAAHGITESHSVVWRLEEPEELHRLLMRRVLVTAMSCRCHAAAGHWETVTPRPRPLDPPTGGWLMPR